MRFPILPGLLIPAIVVSASPLRAEEQGDRLTTGADIIKMHKGGLKEETILEFLKTYQARVVLRDDDMTDMVSAGLSDGFLQQLLAYAKSQPAEPQASAPPDYVPSEEAYSATTTTTFYVGYPYDYSAFPFWFYVGAPRPFFGFPHRHFVPFRHGPVFRHGPFGHHGGRPLGAPFSPHRGFRH